MPKLKVSKSAKKRFKITGTGKLVKEHAFHSHLLEKKSTSRKRRLSHTSVTVKGNERSVKKILGV